MAKSKKTRTPRAHAKATKASATAKDKARKAVIAEIRQRVARLDGVKPGGKGRKPAAPPGPAEPKRLSAMTAAVKVLADAGKPMRVREIVEQMAKQGLWASPNGKTPHATLAASIIREIAAKGKESRFKKVDRGLFAATKGA